MRLTTRGRVVLVGLAAFFLGYVLPGIIQSLRGNGLVCGTSLPGFGTICRAGSRAASVLVAIAVVAVVVAVVIVALVLWALSIWCLRPLRQLIPPIARIGPQNLGYRIRSEAPRGELRSLSDSIDHMMDRVAAGYESQRRFAANASHELRTPLAVQRTLIEVSLAGSLSVDQIELVTRQLLTTNERNERLIEGLLVLSESDQGLLARTPQRLDVITRGVVAAHEAAAATAGVSLSLDLTERTVPGEAVLLERLVTNLVQNAIKYNRPGGEVHVVVAAEPALMVSNTGPEVPPEAVAGLFEPFRRLAGDRIDHSGGAGLGLTIARSVTQAHDGLIQAEPRGRDGLKVEVRLP